MVEIRSNFKVVALILAAVILAALMITVPADAQQEGGGQEGYECPYSDGKKVVLEDLDWNNVHTEAIFFVLCNDIMSTDAERKFHSNDAIDRATAASATLQYFRHRTKLTGGYCGHSGSPPDPFKDVDEATPYSHDIVAAWCLGIWKGVSIDQFAPGSPLTRAQAASVVIATLDAVWQQLYEYRFSESITECVDPRFTDVELDSTHGMAINQLACAGIVQGETFAEYFPQRRLTRGQLASILHSATDWSNWKECCVQ